MTRSSNIRTVLDLMERSDDSPVRAASDRQLDVESTQDLLQLVRAGDHSALDRLFARYMPPLKRWAHGRLPQWARDIRDTDDLVQESVVQTLRQIDRFEPRRDGGFHAYLRKVLYNRLIDEVRRVSKISRTVLESDHPYGGPSPVEEVIGAQALARYDEALAQLHPDEREAVLARVELGCSYHEIAQSMGKPSADAARMMVTRALLRLARGMGNGR